MDFEEQEDPIQSEEVEEPAPVKRRGRPKGVKNKPKDAPPLDTINAINDRIALLEAAATREPVSSLGSVKMKTKAPTHPRESRKEPVRLVGSPTSAARQLCEILRRDGILPAAPPQPSAHSPEPYVDRARETQRQKRDALYASFLS